MPATMSHENQLGIRSYICVLRISMLADASAHCDFTAGDIVCSCRSLGVVPSCNSNSTPVTSAMSCKSKPPLCTNASRALVAGLMSTPMHTLATVVIDMSGCALLHTCYCCDMCYCCDRYVCLAALEIAELCKTVAWGLCRPDEGHEELRCVLAVIRHGDRTPKQKMKMKVTQVRATG